MSSHFVKFTIQARVHVESSYLNSLKGTLSKIYLKFLTGETMKYLFENKTTE